MANDLPHPPTAGARIWRFGAFTFDESSWMLSAGGAPVALEAKPLEILLELLRNAGEVVTKAELLDAVWPNVTVVEGSLTTAVSKLRKVLGDENGTLIATVPKIGYRMNAKVSVAPSARPVSALELRAGESVPGRASWRLELRLGAAPGRHVWRARHDKTGEWRIFKFAADGAQLRRLKREAAIARLLRETLGERPDLAPVLEWNFTDPPWFLECAYGGVDLLQWARDEGGLDAVALETRIALIASVAETIGAAHGIGVLHGDLKPANILAAVDRSGAWQAKVVDFGSADLDDPGRLARAGITGTAFAADGAEAEALRGTALWMAPELLAGAAGGVRSDVYALGVMLYQMVVGDFRKALSPGWEADVADPVLRDDIAAAAAGDPALRLDSAATLAQRLRSLEERRRAHALEQQAVRRAREMERRAERARARRPWIAAAAGLAAAGLVLSVATAWVAVRERDRATQQAATLEAMNQFLASDLLARASPYVSGRPDETLVGAINAAAEQIDGRFRHAPDIAARLHLAIARALDSRNAWADSRRAYERAAALWAQAEGPRSQNALRTRLQQAMMEARSYQGGALDLARRLLAEQEPLIASLPTDGTDIPLWLASARGMIALIANDASEAEAQFRRAVAIGETLDGFDRADLLTLRQRHAFALIRLGRAAEAEALFRELIAGYAALNGEADPSVLRVRLNLAQALMGQGKHAQAIEEADALEPVLVAAMGPDNELSLQLLATRGQSAGALERWQDAIRDNTRLHERATAVLGPNSFFTVVSLADLALAECRSGRLRQGVANAAAAYRTSAQAFGEEAGLTQGVAFAQAQCLILAGRPAEASPLLDGIEARKVAELTGDAHWGGNVALARAEIAYAQGDRTAARRHLAEAEPAFARPGAEAYQVRRWRELARRLH